MKELRFLALLILCSSCAMSQVDNNSKSNWTYGLKIMSSDRDIPFVEENIASAWDNGYLYLGESFNSTTRNRSLALGIVAKRNFDEHLFGRVTAGINHVDVRLLPKTFSSDPSSGINSFDRAYKRRTDFNLSVDRGYNYKLERMSIYCGMGVGAVYYSRAKIDSYTELDSIQNSTPISSFERAGYLYSAISAGVNSFVGVSYSFKKISITGELSSGLYYSRTLGGSNVHLINKDLSTNTILSDVTLEYNPTISLISICKVSPSISINCNF